VSHCHAVGLGAGHATARQLMSGRDAVIPRCSGYHEIPALDRCSDNVRVVHPTCHNPTPRHQRFRWSAARSSGCPVNTARSAATATVGRRDLGHPQVADTDRFPGSPYVHGYADWDESALRKDRILSVITAWSLPIVPRPPRTTRSVVIALSSHSSCLAGRDRRHVTVVPRRLVLAMVSNRVTRSRPTPPETIGARAWVQP